MEECCERAHKMLEENRESLIRLAEALLEYETLDGCDIESIMKGQPIKPREPVASDIDTPRTTRAGEDAGAHPAAPTDQSQGQTCAGIGF